MAYPPRALNNTIEVALLYFFNFVILFNTDPKTCSFKNVEEIQKAWKKFFKN